MGKIISIVGVNGLLAALCEDGTVWKMDFQKGCWQPFPRITAQDAYGEKKTFMNTSVADLAISGRAKGALKRSGIDKVHQLAGLSESALRALPSIGDKSIYEIKQVFAAEDMSILDV
ncbi:MAG: hypothetical protein KBC57_11435 [Neisseriaceae bacterium]|nr:hypothetical protein [Neisseriaceae bacterium]MBP6862946.1 hypothetical protein [Neisseriaceae bacterium]